MKDGKISEPSHGYHASHVKYRLKTPKGVERAVVGTYKRIEDGVVGTYKKIEDSVVGAYKGVEQRFVDAFLEPVEDDPAIVLEEDDAISAEHPAE